MNKVNTWAPEVSFEECVYFLLHEDNGVMLGRSMILLMFHLEGKCG